MKKNRKALDLTDKTIRRKGLYYRTIVRVQVLDVFKYKKLIPKVHIVATKYPFQE